MHRLDDIPASLHSAETDEPFRECADCGGRLRDSEDGYAIQKAYAKGETIMEIAICADCHEALQEEYSAETKERLWNFFLDHAGFSNRLERFENTPVGTIDPWTDQCLTCDATRETSEEFAVAAWCIGDQLIYGEAPFMICITCMDRLVELLSEASRDSYDRWLDRCLPMAPEADAGPPRVRIVV